MSHNASTPIRGRADSAMINNNHTFFYVTLVNLMIIRFDDLDLMTMSYHCTFLEGSRNFQKIFFLKSFFSLWVFCRAFINSRDRIQSLLSIINLFQQLSMYFSAMSRTHLDTL